MKSQKLLFLLMMMILGAVSLKLGSYIDFSTPIGSCILLPPLQIGAFLVVYLYWHRKPARKGFQQDDLGSIFQEKSR